MTSLDQAMKKVFQRREEPAAKLTPSDAASDQVPGAVATTAPVHPASKPVGTAADGRRELFVDAPERRLRGFHRPPGVAQAELSSVSTDSVARPSNAIPVGPRIDSPPPAAAPAMLEELASAEPRSDALGGVMNSVMNSLLSYELSVVPPGADLWPMDELPVPDLHETNSPRPEPNTRSSPPYPPAPAPFKPAWETDAFRLTPACRTIQSQLPAPLQLAAAELLEMMQQSKPVVSVVSTERRAGATTVAVLLARELAKAGGRVALVDADAGTSLPLGEQLGVAVDGSWHQAVISGIEATECAIYSLADKFCVLPLARTVASGRSAADGELPLARLLHRMAGSFDAIVVDNGNDASEITADFDGLVSAYVVVSDAQARDVAQREPVAVRGIAPLDARIRVVENFTVRD